MTSPTLTAEAELLAGAPPVTSEEGAPAAAADGAPEPAGPRMITLRMPRPKNFDPDLVDNWHEFPEGNIDFGPLSIHDPEHDRAHIKMTAIAGQDGFAVVPEDHPLLEAFMARYPQVEIVETIDPTKIYVCPVCDREFTGKLGYRNHYKAAH